MCGKQIIVTDDCGCSEWIRKSQAGYLVKYGDVQWLKQKMAKCLTNSADVKSMVLKGKEYIRSNLQWTQVVRRIEEIYAACINQEN
jgi:glycosyltransferase involved in cell wall biosynthesis